MAPSGGRVAPAAAMRALSTGALPLTRTVWQACPGALPPPRFA
ncbi:hypothetical protein ACIGW3_14230 [Streptomyces sp. NPDC053499]